MAPLDPITLRPTWIKTYHKKQYPAISPFRPELSQAGRTVLIAGASTGIGFAIARAFVQAQASRVILLGRRESALKTAAADLAAESPSNTTAIQPLVCDITDPSSTAKVFQDLKNDNIFVDVLVLNAATTGEIKTVLDAGLASIWKAYEFNARSLLDLAEHFYKQQAPVPGEHRQKYLVNVSSSAVHNFETDAPMMPAYGLTKNAGTLLLQQIAKDVKPEDMQIVSFHPGGVLTEMGKNAGIPEDLYDWDDEGLPGGFAVWLATSEASFAHGRMVASHWDLDELKAEAEKRIVVEGQGNFLKLGLIGI